MYDEECGIYYIDHNTQSTYLDPPWDKRVQEHYRALKEHLTLEEKRLQKQKQLEEEKRIQLQQANVRVADLERKKSKLEVDLKKEKSKSQASLVETKLDEVKVQLEQERAEAQKIAQEHEKLTQEIEEFQSRLDELKQLNERLTAENQSQLEAAKQTNRELQAVKELMETEAAQRSALETYVMQLKSDILSIAKDKKRKKEEEASSAAVSVEKASEPMAVDEPVKEKEPETVKIDYTAPPSVDSADEIIEDEPVVVPRLKAISQQERPVSSISTAPKKKPAMDKARKLQLDMELELLALKKRLQAEQRERIRLQKMAEQAEKVKEKVQESVAEQAPAVVPDWVKKINVYASKSKTLRVKIGKQQKANPDDLSFTEKMMFFTAGAVESSVEGVLPVPGEKPGSRKSSRAPQPKLDQLTE